MMQQGKPVFHYNFVNLAHYNIAAPNALAPGKHKIVVSFKYDDGGIGKGGTATISVDGRQVAQGRVEKTIPIRIALDEGLDIGEDSGTPVSTDYDVPFKFTGEIKKVAIESGKSGLTASDEKMLEKANKKLMAVRD